MFLSKNKFFVLVLLLSVTFYLMWAPTARAESVFNPFAWLEAFDDYIGEVIEDNVELVFIAIVVVALVVSQQYGLLPAVIEYGSTNAAILTTAAGEMITLTPALASAVTLGAGETLLTLSVVYSVATNLVIAGVSAVAGMTALILTTGGDTGAMLVSVDPTQYECDAPQQFQIPVTFYIPSFNQGYVAAPDTYCYFSGRYDSNGDSIDICNSIPAGAQRYSSNDDYDNDPADYNKCGIPNSSGQFAMVDGACVNVTPGVTTLTSIDETNRQIALYRVTAPISQFQTASGETNKSALVKWFTGVSGSWGVSEHTFGDGLARWTAGMGGALEIIKDRPETNRLAIVDYSDACSGNFCKFTDGIKIPEKSYIFYAAKILGDYKWPVEEKYYPDPDSTYEIRTSYVSSPAKFLSIQNSPIQGNIAMFPWIAKTTYSMGDALWGPTQTGSLEACPAATQTPQDTLADLIVSTTGTGSGLITSTVGGLNAGGFNCGISNGINYTTCSNTYDIGASVTLTATPAANSSFTGWSGECSGKGTCKVKMDADKSAVATFASQPKLTVTKSGNGSGKVTSNGGVIFCGSTCYGYYSSGAKTVLISSADTGSTFKGWSGACSGTGFCVLTMDTDKTVNAEFSQSSPGNFNVSIGGGGGATCNSVPLSWTVSSGATAYRILKGSPRVDISPYRPYTALSFADPDGSPNSAVNQNTGYTYQIEAYNDAGSNRSNTINVTTPYCSPTVDLSASPAQVYQGQSSKLTWTSTNATSCVASGAWSGSRSANNSAGENAFPSTIPTTTYTLICSGPGGSASDSTNIEVLPLGLPGWKEIIPR